MNRIFSAQSIVLAAVFLAMPFAAVAQEGPPLQVDARVRAEPSGHLAATFERRIEPGVATMSGRVFNLPAGDTAVVKLRFDYKTDFDVALDEIISLIVISLENADGKEVARTTIDPNNVHLNPNRVPLHYSATLYKPHLAETRGYIVRVRLFGNYE